MEMTAKRGGWRLQAPLQAAGQVEAEVFPCADANCDGTVIRGPQDRKKRIFQCSKCRQKNCVNCKVTKPNNYQNQPFGRADFDE